MAVVVHVILRNLTPAQYNDVRSEAAWLERAPAGGYAHLTWWEGVDCHNMDAWEDEAAFNAFGQDRLGPAMAKLGIAIEPEVTFHPAHEVYTPQSVKLT
jgi:hypothetical protein